MKRALCIFVLLTALLAACDSGSTTKAPAAATSTPSAAQSGPSAGGPTNTPAAAQSGPTAAANSAPANTPSNVVPTASAGSANTSFQTAKPLGKDPIKFGVKESEFFFKIDVAPGGIISATLAVDSGSPAPAKMTLYNALQEYVSEVAVPVGKSALLRHIFNSKGGGTVFLSVRGESNVTLSAQALTQNDGNSKGDAGDDLDKPTTVVLGTLTGIVGDDDTEDDYIVDLPKTGGVFKVAVRTSDGAVKAEVYNDKQDWVYAVNSDKNQASAVDTAAMLLGTGQGGRWIVSVRGSGTYTLAVSFAPQSDAGSGKDAPDDINQALLIKPGAYTGVVGGTDTDDYYAFELPKSGGVLNVTLKSADGSVKATVNDDNQSWIGELKADKDHADGAVFRYVIPVNKGGKWYLDVNGEGSYAFTLAFAAQNDGGSGKDAGDSTSTAVTPRAPDFTGTLGDTDESDYYKIPAAMGRKLNVKFTKGEGQLHVTLYDKDGNYLKDIHVGSGESADLIEDSGATTDYFIEVASANGDYAVKISM